MRLQDVQVKESKPPSLLLWNLVCIQSSASIKCSQTARQHKPTNITATNELGRRSETGDQYRVRAESLKKQPTQHISQRVPFTEWPPDEGLSDVRAPAENGAESLDQVLPGIWRLQVDRDICHEKYYGQRDIFFMKHCGQVAEPGLHMFLSKPCWISDPAPNPGVKSFSFNVSVNTLCCCVLVVLRAKGSMSSEHQIYSPMLMDLGQGQPKAIPGIEFIEVHTRNLLAEFSCLQHQHTHTLFMCEVSVYQTQNC